MANSCVCIKYTPQRNSVGDMIQGMTIKLRGITEKSQQNFAFKIRPFP